MDHPRGHRARQPVCPLTVLAAVLVLAGVQGELAWAQQRPVSVEVRREPQLNAGLGEPPKALDRSTPYRAFSALITACRSRRWDDAAHLLNLGEVPASEQKTLGTTLGYQLCEVLRVTAQTSAQGLSDLSTGPMAEDGPRNYVVVARFAMPEGIQDAWLRRTLDQKSGKEHWVLAHRSVSKIQAWYLYTVKKEKILKKSADSIHSGLGERPESFNLSTPRQTVARFLDLTREGSYPEAAWLLDLSGFGQAQQQSQGARLARRLALLGKHLHLSAARLSDEAVGTPEVGLSLDEEMAAQGRVGRDDVQLRLTRLSRREGGPVWLFSASTVAAIDGWYSQLGYGWAGDVLPPLFFEWTLLRVQLWQWVGLCLFVMVGLGVAFLLSLVSRRLLTKAAGFTRWSWDDQIVTLLRGPLALAYWAIFCLSVVPLLALPDRAAHVVTGAFKLLLLLAAGWVLLRLSDMGGGVLLQRFKERDDTIGLSMVPVARKIIKVVIVAIVIIFALQNLGLDVASLLAGLGIGGLAFALAAKTTLENLLGGVTIAFDRPFKLGDFIKVGDLSGTVEDLGLRSTRLRTLDRSVVTIPNGQLVDSKIENWGLRDRTRLLCTIGLQYDTSPDQLCYVLDELKRHLLVHPKVYPEDQRVRFSAFGESSLDIEISCYILATTIAEFASVREQVLLEVGRIVERAGASFAFPSQTVYRGEQSPKAHEKVRAAEQEVQRRREAGELGIPEIPEAVKARLGARPSG